MILLLCISPCLWHRNKYVLTVEVVRLLVNIKLNWLRLGSQELHLVDCVGVSTPSHVVQDTMCIQTYLWIDMLCWGFCGGAQVLYLCLDVCEHMYVPRINFRSSDRLFLYHWNEPIQAWLDYIKGKFIGKLLSRQVHWPQGLWPEASPWQGGAGG